MGGPTQEDVARRANVSRALVSLVMREAPNVSEERRRRVLRAAEELGYRPHAAARSLASKSMRTIGVLIYDITNPYLTSVYASLAVAAEREGLDLLVAPGMRSAAREITLVNTLLEHRVAGLALVSPVMKSADLHKYAAMWPTVVVGRAVSFPGVDVVTTDEHQAARRVIAHLVELGHRHIVHITGGAGRAAADRATAYRHTMREFGLTPREIPGSFTEQGGRSGAARILELKPIPTALIAANDLIAVGAMGIFRTAGLRVPEDMSVVGFDDSQVASLELIRLTSVHQSVEQFGPAAISLLTRRIDGANRDSTIQRIATTLVERDTTGPAR